MIKNRRAFIVGLKSSTLSNKEIEVAQEYTIEIIKKLESTGKISIHDKLNINKE